MWKEITNLEMKIPNVQNLVDLMNLSDVEMKILKFSVRWWPKVVGCRDSEVREGDWGMKENRRCWETWKSAKKKTMYSWCFSPVRVDAGRTIQKKNPKFLNGEGAPRNEVRRTALWGACATFKIFGKFWTMWGHLTYWQIKLLICLFVASAPRY